MSLFLHSFLLSLNLFRSCLLGLIALEEIGELLKRRARGFDEEEVDDQEGDGHPYAVVDVELPSEVRETDRVDIASEDGRDLDGKQDERPSLGSHLVGDDLQGVCDDEIRPGQGVESLEDEDASQDESATREAAALDVLLRGDGPDNEGDEHTGGASDEEEATPEAINHHGDGQGDDVLPESDHAVHQGDFVFGLQAGILENLREVVRDKLVTGGLREESGTEAQRDSLEVGDRREELLPGHVVLSLHGNRLLNLGILESNKVGRRVAFAVVLDEDLLGLLRPALGDQPSRRFGAEVDEGALVDRRNDLDQGGEPPRPRTVDAVASKGCPGTDNIAQYDGCVVECGHCDALLGVAEFGDQDGGSHLDERGADAEHDLATDVHVERSSKELNDDSHDNNNRSEQSRQATAEGVTNPAEEQKRDHAANGIGGTEETERGACRVSKSILPRHKDLHAVRHGLYTHHVSNVFPSLNTSMLGGRGIRLNEIRRNIAGKLTPSMPRAMLANSDDVRRKYKRMPFFLL